MNQENENCFQQCSKNFTEFLLPFTHTVLQTNNLIPSNLLMDLLMSQPSFCMKRDVTIDYKVNLGSWLNLKSD